MRKIEKVRVSRRGTKSYIPRSARLARLVRRYHIFDVDEGILTAVELEGLQGLLDEVAEVHALPLRVVHRVADVQVPHLEDVEDRQDLAVVGHERLADHLARRGVHHELQELEDGRDDLGVAGVEPRLNRDDELWHNREDLRAALVQEVVRALDREEAVRLLLLADAVE